MAKWIHGAGFLPWRSSVPHKTLRTSSTRQAISRLYKIPGADIPIVHRRARDPRSGNRRKSSKSKSKTQDTSDRCGKSTTCLRREDNNYVDDIELYQGLEWLERKHIVGKGSRVSILQFAVFGISHLSFTVQLLAIRWICHNRYGEVFYRRSCNIRS